MNLTKRFLFQSIFWFAIWIAGWLIVDLDTGFVTKNAPSFLLQIVMIAFLIYFAAPKLLFKKKYIAFLLVSLLLIVVCSFFISYSFQEPLHHLARPQVRMGGPKPPPKFLIDFLVLTITFVLTTFMETFLFAQKKEKETIRNKNENLQTELKLLKSQINPHFLFNSLNNIYALSVINSDKTQLSIAYLSDMLRYVLYECEQPLVPLKNEITYIENYLKLFAIKSSKKYPIQTTYELSNKNARIAPMLFIPFLENAFKHGNLERISDSFLKIKITSTDTTVNFQIENSKPKSPILKDKMGGIGLENVKKRLAILYPKQHELTIIEETSTFKVNLKLEVHV